MTSPSILLGLPHGNRLGGVTTWSLNVAAELAKDGHRAGILIHASNKASLYDQPPGVDFVHLKGPPADWALRFDVLEAKRKLNAWKATVFFPNGGHCGYVAAAYHKKNNPDLRIVGMAHSDESYYYDTLIYYAPIIDRFLGVSYAIADKLKSLLPENRHADIFCLPYGVPIPEQMEREANGVLKLLYAGRVAEYQKRVSRLAELAEILERLRIPFELHVAGDGPERVALEEKMKGRAVFHGSLSPEKVSLLMRECNVIVQLSDFEGTSLTMLEAMAAGMVPVMSAVTGIDAVVENGVSGLLQAVGDVEKAADQIAMLHHDRSLLKTIGVNAREKVSRDFSIAGNATKISQLCHNLVGQPADHRHLGKPAFPISKEFGIFYAKARGKIRTELGKIFK